MPVGRSRHILRGAAALAALTALVGCGANSTSGSNARPSITAPSASTGSHAPPTTSSAPATGTTPPPGPSSPAATTYFGQYGASTHAYRPPVLNPSVDGSLSISGMRWRLWNGQRAVGTGVAHVNDCKPDCADGRYTTHPVTVRLSQPRELCGSRFFTAIRLNGPTYQTRAQWAGIGCG